MIESLLRVYDAGEEVERDEEVDDDDQWLDKGFGLVLHEVVRVHRFV